MELKFIGYGYKSATAAGSNRTFMELKFIGYGYKSATAAGSNRTFMELKFGGKYNGRYKPYVLIAPLWN